MPALGDRDPEIGLFWGHIGEVEQLIMKKGVGKLAAKSMFTFVLIDRNSGASVPIAGKIRSLLSNIIHHE